MKKGLSILLVAVIALTSFSNKNKKAKQAKITYVHVVDWPKTNANGQAWDNDSNPDVYMMLVTSKKGGSGLTDDGASSLAGRRPKDLPGLVDGLENYVQVANDPLDDVEFKNTNQQSLRRSLANPFLVSDLNNTYLALVDNDDKDNDDLMGLVHLNFNANNLTEDAVIFMHQGVKVEVGVKWQ